MKEECARAKLWTLESWERPKGDSHGSAAATRQPPPARHMDCIAAELWVSADEMSDSTESFFGSVPVIRWPRGVGRAIVTRYCPKIGIPNTGTHPDMFGLALLDCLQWIIDMVRKDVPRAVVVTDAGDKPVDPMVHFCLIGYKTLPALHRHG